jgi:hypothetical protein
VSKNITVAGPALKPGKAEKRDNLRDTAQLLVSEILTFGGREFDASALNHLKYSKLSAMA